MIVIITKTDRWTIPRIELDPKFNYKIGVRRINFKAQAGNLEHNQLICLKSTVVDLSSRNPLQSLELLTYDSAVQIQSFCPSVVCYYPLQLRNLTDASFDLIDPWSEHKISFSDLFLQLEILRHDSYGRIF